MATKTVVCPECGSPVAPGRYACADCGALLAAVGPAPRSRRRSAAGSRTSARPAGASEDPAELQAAEDDTVGEAASEPELTPHADTPVAVDPAPDVAGAPTAVAAQVDADDPIAHDEEPEDPWEDASGAFDEDAPLAAARPRRQPDVLHDAPLVVPTDDTPLASSTPSADDVPIPNDVPIAAAPSWPPPGDRGPVAAPEPRTPAGAYLPPSAVLPPLDGPISASGSVAGVAMALPAGSVALGGARGSAATRSAWTAGGSAALTNALGSVRVTADASRRAIAAGAGLAGLGILLPWVNTLPGASPFANYLDRWGLAGPGLWLVLVGLVLLMTVAASSGRAASWPVGLPAIVSAAFLAGLVWPYAVGGFGRSIGTWVVIVGAVVLLVGGVLDRMSRHDRGDASV